jgi:hypothetical protein
MHLHFTFRALAEGRVDLRKHQQAERCPTALWVAERPRRLLPLRIRARALRRQPELVHLPEGLVGASGPPPCSGSKPRWCCSDRALRPWCVAGGGAKRVEVDAAGRILRSLANHSLYPPFLRLFRVPMQE